MDKEKLRGVLWRYNSKLQGRLCGSRTVGLEDFYRLGEKLNGIGNFVIAHYDDLSLEDISEVLDLYAKLEGTHIINGSRVDTEANSKNAETLSPLLSDMEEKLNRTHGYENDAAMKARQEKVDGLTKSMELIEADLDFCSTQYVMNKNRFKEMGASAEMAIAYSTCVDYVQASLENVRTAITQRGSLGGLSEVLVVDKRLVELLNLLIETQDLEKLGDRLSSFMNVLTVLTDKEKALKGMAQ